ncbi:MAG: TlpA family protein disulfide reductase [Luteimonas sp.]
MIGGSGRVVLVALAAGTVGVIASLAFNGPSGALLQTDAGQRIALRALRASAATPPAGVAIAERGQPVPPFVLDDLDGQRVALPAAYAGRPVLINLWASWCAPCVREMPELQRFHAAQGDTGTQVVGIALDDRAAVLDFLARVPVAYPILRDAAGPADAGVRLGNVKGVLPYSLLLAANGTLLKERIGPFADGEIDAWARSE